MYEFLILGLIPGTEVRISFGAWVTVSIAVLVALTYRKNLRAAVSFGRLLWAMRYHLAALVALAAISLKRKLSS